MEKVTSKQMNLIDSFCIKAIGIPGIVLMENAALKVIKNIDLNSYNNFTIVAGVGNNGGDGLAIGRHLSVLGKNVNVFVIGNVRHGSKDFVTNYSILRNMNIHIHHILEREDLKHLQKSVRSSEMIIDAIFGTGLSRNIEGLFERTISIINKSDNFILSVDIPSGLSSDTGEILNTCIKANKTVTFQLLKKGLVENSGEKYAGEIVVEPIGMPKIAIEKGLRNF